MAEQKTGQDPNLWQRTNDWLAIPRNQKIAIGGSSAMLLFSMYVVCNARSHNKAYTRADGSRCVEKIDVVGYTKMCQRDNGSVEVIKEWPIGFERYIAGPDCELSLVEGPFNDYSVVEKTMSADIKRVWTQICQRDMNRFKPYLRHHARKR